MYSLLTEDEPVYIKPRTYMGADLFGVRLVRLTREEYDRMPRLLRRLADWLLVINKRA